MAGNKNSGRKPIPEGAVKEKNGNFYIRKSRRWVLDDDRNKERNNENENSHSEENKGDEVEIPDKKEAKEGPRTGPPESRDYAHEVEERERTEFNVKPERDIGSNIGIVNDDAERLNKEFLDMSNLLAAMPEEVKSESLKYSDTQQSDNKSQSVKIKGRHIISFLDLAGSRGAAFVESKLTKKKSNFSDFKLTSDEKEELQEAAEAAAETINFKASESPWVNLIVLYILIIALKVSER